MVAKVITGKDIKGALNYNEQKVMQGKAECIDASLFVREVSELNFYNKLERFMTLQERNQRTKTNTLHISLNFDPSEKLNKETLVQIAAAYMDKLGFGEQPYLLYRHDDAAHPHVHVVTTNIQEDGKRIPLHNIGKERSEPARKEVEEAFGLVKAEGRGKAQQVFIHPVAVQKGIYGKLETKRSISNVVRMVTRDYKYTSLPELNAVLGQFNVTAYRGSERSQMFVKGGLVYSLINEKGERVGIPVKASAIEGKPTLAFLETQYKLKEALRNPFKDRLKSTIDRSLGAAGIRTKAEWTGSLLRQGVAVVFRTNAEGRTYGITFVDHRNKTVFNGSSLGKPYGAKAIMEKLNEKAGAAQAFRSGYSTAETSSTDNKLASPFEGVTETFKALLQSETDYQPSPEAMLKLRKKKRKKRRKS